VDLFPTFPSLLPQDQSLPEPLASDTEALETLLTTNCYEVGGPTTMLPRTSASSSHATDYCWTTPKEVSLLCGMWHCCTLVVGNTCQQHSRV
jgi:hypothetical protein